MAGAYASAFSSAYDGAAGGGGSATAGAIFTSRVFGTIVSALILVGWLEGFA